MLKKIVAMLFLVLFFQAYPGNPIAEGIQDQNQPPLNPVLNIGQVFHVKFNSVGSLYAFQEATEAFADNRLKSLKDSKILTKEELLKISPRILKNSWHSFAMVDNNDIDKFNIYQATLVAMRQAVLNLLATCPKLPKTILVDALPLNLKNTAYEGIEIYNFPKGESLSRSIAAASIIAKVKRDDLMAKYDAVVPGYSFGQHKGYGTKIHQNALSNLGDSILHRQSYLKKFSHLFIESNTHESTSDTSSLQQSIFCRSD